MRNRKKKGLQKILISRTSKEKPILKTETQKSGYDRQIKRREILRGLSEKIMMHAYIHTTTHIRHFVLIVHNTMGVLMVMLMMHWCTINNIINNYSSILFKPPSAKHSDIGNQSALNPKGTRSSGVKYQTEGECVYVWVESGIKNVEGGEEGEVYVCVCTQKSAHFN